MNLSEFPLAIARIERQQLRLSKKIRTAQAHLDKLTGEIECKIATDPELKNDQQRKARRLELLNSGDYQTAQTILNTYSDRRIALDINLSLLRNQFSVAKLEVRQTIARDELSVA